MLRYTRGPCVAEQMFTDQILIRTEPTLRQALNEIARAEMTTTSEFVRRELRGVVARFRSVRPSDESDDDCPVAKEDQHHG